MIELFTLLAVAVGQGVPQHPLRLDPVGTIIRDLSEFVPARMREDGVPGMAVALLRDGRVAWVGAFGVANVLSRRPVTPDTPFPAASLGKPLAAYTALRLAGRGVWRLDETVADHMPRGWTRDEARAGRITVRHLLAHTSGLSNFLGDRERRPRFEPGDSFAYSGVGYMVLQRLLETAGTASLDEVVARETLRPLGLRAVRFGPGPVAGTPPAAGHIPLDRAVAPFGIVFLPLLAMGAIAAAPFRRLRGRFGLLSLVAATATTAFLVNRAANPRMVPFFVLAFGGFAAASLAAGWLAARAPTRRRWVPPAVTALTAVALFALARGIVVPVPAGIPPAGNAASSLRATAGDLAVFLLELAEPEHLDPALAAELVRPQARAGEHLAWGLGIGLQQALEGDALFHWGSNPAARAAMLVYPGAGVGVVVLANSGTAGDAVEDVALRAVRGPRYWLDE